MLLSSLQGLCCLALRCQVSAVLELLSAVRCLWGAWHGKPQLAEPWACKRGGMGEPAGDASAKITGLLA